MQSARLLLLLSKKARVEKRRAGGLKSKLEKLEAEICKGRLIPNAAAIASAATEVSVKISSCYIANACFQASSPGKTRRTNRLLRCIE